MWLETDPAGRLQTALGARFGRTAVTSATGDALGLDDVVGESNNGRLDEAVEPPP